MNLRMKPLGGDTTELLFEDGAKAISLTSMPDDDGTLRVIAVVNYSLAKDIIDGLRLLDVVRAVSRTTFSAVPPRGA